jgi:hypothetical protein
MKATTIEGEQLRRMISQREYPSSGLSEELRQRATSYARRRAAEGAPQRVIAEELGVSTVSIGRWLGARHSTARQSAALVPVHVIAEPTERASGFEIVTLRGLRVVGLDLEALCAVLERHG